jgi:hypothetical protein
MSLEEKRRKKILDNGISAQWGTGCNQVPVSFFVFLCHYLLVSASVSASRAAAHTDSLWRHSSPLPLTFRSPLACIYTCQRARFNKHAMNQIKTITKERQDFHQKVNETSHRVCLPVAWWSVTSLMKWSHETGNECSWDEERILVLHTHPLVRNKWNYNQFNSQSVYH